MAFGARESTGFEAAIEVDVAEESCGWIVAGGQLVLRHPKDVFDVAAVDGSPTGRHANDMSAGW
jgi:hypothetical protein